LPVPPARDERTFDFWLRSARSRARIAPVIPAIVSNGRLPAKNQQQQNRRIKYGPPCRAGPSRSTLYMQKTADLHASSFYSVSKKPKLKPAVFTDQARGEVGIAFS